MKRIISLAISVLMIMSISAFGFADVDLSGMSYDELVALKDQINLAIWQSDDWQEVEVPQGVWLVGEDIPAGKWTIKAAKEASTFISVGDAPTDDGTGVKATVMQAIYDPEYMFYNAKSDIFEWTIDLAEGKYVEIDNGVAIFTPYAGKPSLGFKK